MILILGGRCSLAVAWAPRENVLEDDLLLRKMICCSLAVAWAPGENVLEDDLIQMILEDDPGAKMCWKMILGR